MYAHEVWQSVRQRTYGIGDVSYGESRAGYLSGWELHGTIGKSRMDIYRMRCKDGDERWFVARLAAILDTQGALIYVLLVQQDVTGTRSPRTRPSGSRNMTP